MFVANWHEADEIGKMVEGNLARRTPDRAKPEGQPHAKQITHAPQPAMRGADKEREAVPIGGDVERPLPDARRNVPGRTEG